MNSVTNNTRVAGIALAVFAVLALGVAVAPLAHAADLSVPDYYGGSDWMPTSYYDTASPSYDTSSYYGGSDWIPTSYYDTASPSYDYPSTYGSSGCSSCGGFSNPGFGFGGSGFGGGSSSTFAPTTVSNNIPTSIYAPQNTNICTGGNVCNTSTNVDDHSIFNAPTTVTISNPTPAQTQTQIVYQPQPYPVYQPQQPIYPVYNTPCYSCQQQPVIYPTPVRQPYVSLNSVPYTGLDLGPVGTALYWGFLVLWCLVAAYLIVYKRVQTKVVAGLNAFLFGGATVGTHAKVVHHVTPAKAHVAKAEVNEDAIDPFIASQIARNK